MRSRISWQKNKQQNKLKQIQLGRRNAASFESTDNWQVEIDVGSTGAFSRSKVCWRFIPEASLTREITCKLCSGLRGRSWTFVTHSAQENVRLQHHARPLNSMTTAPPFHIHSVSAELKTAPGTKHVMYVSLWFRGRLYLCKSLIKVKHISKAILTLM